MYSFFVVVVAVNVVLLMVFTINVLFTHLFLSLFYVFLVGGPIRFCLYITFFVVSCNLFFNEHEICIGAAVAHRLSTKSLLNLATKTVPGHVLKHGYVLFSIFL